MHCNTQSMHTTHHAGVFSYAPTAPSGDGSLPQVNCTLTASFASTSFPLKLLLLLTGIVLIIVDVNISIILCLIKYCGCAVLTIVWFLVETVCLFAWVAWSIVYLEAVFPAWLEDKALCDDLIMITTIVAVCMACIFAALYAVAILVVICYESKRRCDENCSCC